MTNLDPKYRLDPKIPAAAVVIVDNYYLIPIKDWNHFSDRVNDLICVHSCDGTHLQPFFVSWDIDAICPYCKSVAPDKIQTLYILHNGHY